MRNAKTCACCPVSKCVWPPKVLKYPVSLRKTPGHQADTHKARAVYQTRQELVPAGVGEEVPGA
jgi:hypothetical protein